MNRTESEMFAAVERADPAYDDLFFFAVVTTGIFCYPSCTCRKPRRENVRFFATRQDALDAGFRPCKRCRSDLEGGVAAWNRHMAERVAAMVEADPSLTADRLATALSVSTRHLQRIVRAAVSMSVHEYILRRRVERAASLLSDSGTTVLDVAIQSGFESSSAFYAAFDRIIGVTPAAYRRTSTREADA